MFWGSKTVLLDIWDEIFDLVDKESGDSDQACDADGNKGEPGLAKIEAINSWIYKGEYFKEAVVDPIGEGCLTQCQYLRFRNRRFGREQCPVDELTYMFVNAIAGSLTIISMGLMIASQNTSETDNFSWSSSL